MAGHQGMWFLRVNRQSRDCSWVSFRWCDQSGYLDGMIARRAALPGNSASGGLTEMDYFRVARQPGAIAITSYKPTSQY
jgi:hypothetical protein